MKSTETEVTPKAQEPIIVTPATFDSDMPAAPQGLFADNLSTISLSSFGVETHSVPAIDPDHYARLLSKEGPIPQYDIDDNAVRVNTISRRYENAGVQLVEGMAVADMLRTRAVEQALADKEVARTERDKQRAMVEAIKNQLLRSVEAWVQDKTSEIESLFENRIKADDQITVVAEQIAEDAIRSVGNIHRELNAGSETLKLQQAQCEEAETTALKLEDRKKEIETALHKQRKDLKKYNEALKDLTERDLRIPEEMATLKRAEKAERERLFKTNFEEQPGQFEKYDNDYMALIARRQEIIDNEVSSVELDRILGDIRSKVEEEANNKAAISACMGLIATCTQHINRLTQVLKEIPGQLILQHDSFSAASRIIKEDVDRHSQNFADKAASLGPIATGEARLTRDEAMRLGFLPLARRTQQLRTLFTERQPLLDEEIDLNFNPAHDMPALSDPFGEPVKIPVPHRFIPRSRAEQEESDTQVAEKPSIKHRVGRKMASMFFGSANINENTLVTPREIEA